MNKTKIRDDAGREAGTGRTVRELMTPARAQKLDAIVEQAIDEFGLQKVVDSVARICNEKGAHVADTWNDLPLAGWWHRRASLIGNAADKIGRENT